MGAGISGWCGRGPGVNVVRIQASGGGEGEREQSDGWRSGHPGERPPASQACSGMEQLADSYPGPREVIYKMGGMQERGRR